MPGRPTILGKTVVIIVRVPGLKIYPIIGDGSDYEILMEGQIVGHNCAHGVRRDCSRVTMGGPTSICETVGAGLGRCMDRWTAEQRAPKEFGTALQAQTFQRVYSGRHGLKIRAIPTE